MESIHNTNPKAEEEACLNFCKATKNRQSMDDRYYSK